MLEPRVSLITLGTADLEGARRFYTEVVGWMPAEGPPEICFFDLGGVIFSLYPHESLAADMQAKPGARGEYEGFALAYNARSRAEVDAIFARLNAKGATIVKPPAEAFWGGYSGYFADPDGHRWEVAHNPFWTITPDGRVALTPS
jgi:catechol 2,3-dioxygenase-like lactoylglutathione lyase family enzyme